MTTVTGSVFIVPNDLLDITDEEWVPEFVRDGKLEQLRRLSISDKDRNGNPMQVYMVGLTGDPGLLVQVWYCDETCDNWGSHPRHDLDNSRRGPFFGSNGLSDHLPVALFDDKAEGDTITLNYTSQAGDQYRLVLTLNQQGFRYRRFGNFEEVLQRLVEVKKSA
jgi:hypothetical protein